jgi:hypothetical protein
LANKQGLTFSTSSDGLELSVPARAPDSVSSTVVLNFKGSAALEIEQTSALAQNADGSVLLPASEARTHGAIQYESGERRDNLGFWTNPADWAEWDFKLTKPGKFEIMAEVATTGKSALELRSGQEKLKGEVPNTGDFGNFERVKLGTMEIKSSGRTTLALHAIAEGWSPVNVKLIRLKLAE